MKNKKGEIIRAHSLIESDRLSAGNDFFEILKRDLSVLLKDYFEYNDNLNVCVCKKEGRYEFNLSVKIDRIRPFGILPK